MTLRTPPSGFIFGCNNATEPICRQKRVFGLSNKYRQAVAAIIPGTPLFLYNFDAKVLYGVFCAAGNGGWDLDPMAFEGQYRAQVFVKGINTLRKMGEVLPKEIFRQAIAENFFLPNRFHFQLTQDQVDKLIRLYKQQGWNDGDIVLGTRTNLAQAPRVGFFRRGGTRGRGNRVTGRDRRREPVKVLKLSPGMVSLARRRGQQRRLFEPLMGYRVVVDDKHPVVEYLPPGRSQTAPEWSPVDDVMEIEESHRPTLQFSTVDLTPMQHGAGIPQSGIPTAIGGMQESQAMGKSVEHWQKERDVGSERRDVGRSLKRKIVREEEWRLTEAEWSNLEEFRRFLRGDTDLPRMKEQSVDKLSSSRDVSATVKTRDERAHPYPTNETKESERLSIGMEVARMKSSPSWPSEVESELDKVVDATPTTVESQITDLTSTPGLPNKDKQAESVERVEISEDLKYQISSMFASIGYTVAMERLPDNADCNGSSRSKRCRLKVALTPRPQ